MICSPTRYQLDHGGAPTELIDKTSSGVCLFVVLQVSVLGPKNYCMYTKLIGEIIKRHNIKYHCYMDDTQVYKPLKLKSYDKWEDISSSIEICIADIRIWMSSDTVKSNKD